MAGASSTDLERAFLRILDEDDSPQRYPLGALLQAVQEALGLEVDVWRIFRAWGQGPRTAQLTDALDGVDVADEMEITTETLLDLDDEPNEWFFDVIIRTSDRSLSFGILTVVACSSMIRVIWRCRSVGRSKGSRCTIRVAHRQ